MPTFPRKLFALLLGVLVVTAGCDRSTARKQITPAKTKPQANRVVAVSYPLQYLTERIVGDSIKVEMPVATGVDPQNWQPTRDAIAAMQTADLIIANGNGATYAHWLTTVSLPESKLCFSATRGLSLSDYIPVEDVRVVHSHGPEGEHSHATMVARTWLDPSLAKQQAIYIAERLKKIYPALADQFDGNLKSLAVDLDQLSTMMDPIKKLNATVITSSPRLKFFTRAMGVTDWHLAWFEMPPVVQAKSDLETLLARIPEPRPNLIMFENNPPIGEWTDVLTRMGLTPVMIDLVDQEPSTGDFLTAMRANIVRFEAALN